ncbi:GNAT family N-acetyltransferase [Acetobacterium bakii]|uniref:GCN5 family acetyltransferase n=1 Tax=Acetobacterium bakii TaxID=52689 RepID=A0A0L6TZZ1_9FIRM|nr:GNAT family protein [Acetobacterium bakii]KNZ41829.1 GCN5 family acetyltransferase [Acetobacterium bakii]
MEFELRDWKLDDAESIVRYANNPKLAENLRNEFPSPYTLDDAHTFIDQCRDTDRRKQSIKAIVVDGVAVGSVGFTILDDVECKTALLGFWLGEPFWGKGIMTKAITETCENGFKNYDIVRIFARPFAGNTGARRVLEKAGLKLECILKKNIYKNGKIMDSCMYAIVK